MPRPEHSPRPGKIPCAGGDAADVNCLTCHGEGVVVCGVREEESSCPVCGGVGFPWGGWFHCDGTCHAIAVVSTGQVFVPVTCRPLPEEMRG